MSRYDAELLAVLTRLADVLDRMAPPPAVQTPLDPGASPDRLPIDQGPEPVKPRSSSVTVIRRNYLATDEPEMDERGLTSGGTPPEEFWARPDPDKAAMKRTRKLPMGRRFT